MLRTRPMTALRFDHRRLQRGGFLLEALISVLIVSFGILGLVGLHARSLQHVADAQYRAEAAALANSLIGQMWADVKDPAILAPKYESVSMGSGYSEFKAMVDQRLPGASTTPPTVTFTSLPAPWTLNSPIVSITIFWQPPGESTPHRYEITTTIGKN
jgi:type IV pilus assembly protein PilV